MSNINSATGDRTGTAKPRAPRSEQEKLDIVQVRGKKNMMLIVLSKINITIANRHSDNQTQGLWKISRIFSYETKLRSGRKELGLFRIDGFSLNWSAVE